MSARKVVMIAALAVIAGGIGASRGLSSMRASYDGVCIQLVGFPGLLQRMNFFEEGNCRTKKGEGNKCQDEGECTVSAASGKKKGKCRSMPSGCTCVADKDDKDNKDGKDGKDGKDK